MNKKYETARHLLLEAWRLLDVYCPNDPITEEIGQFLANEEFHYLLGLLNEED